MDMLGVIVVIVAMTAGAIVQGSTGIGLTLIAGPAVLAVDTDYAPGPFLVMGAIVSIRNLIGDRDCLDVQAFKRSVLGIPFGVVVAVALLQAIPERRISIVVGLTVCVLTAVLLLGWRPARTPTSETATGAAVALTATAAGMPGPPLAIGYHDLEPRALRAMAGAFVSTVIAISLIALFATGDFGGREIELSIIALPGVVIGLFATRWTRPYFDRPTARTIVLTLAFAGGAALLIRQI